MNDRVYQPPTALSDLSESAASRRAVIAALVFVAVAIVAALASGTFGERRWPAVLAFIPVSGTLWAAAELLTVYLLVTQFMVTGVRLFLALGAAYAVTGLLTIPYLLAYPGMIGGFGSLGMQQISITVWSLWHVAFPAMVAVGVLRDRGIGARALDEGRRRRECVVVLDLVVIACISTTALVALLRDWIPVFITQGRFTPLFAALMPGIALANAAAAVLVVRQRPPLTALHVWLAVALAIAAIDAALNAFSGGRYSPSWYTGKALTLATASVVLVALLARISALYQRVGKLAMTDSLTGLRNRRTFDATAAWTFNLLRRQRDEVAMLMIDVDFFKGYNDDYGHAAGDACLCRIGEVLELTLRRGGDIVARYGGEEFVALLPHASRESAADLAERLRSGVQALAIPHRGAAAGAGVVTISVGVAHAREIIADDPAELLALADRALYIAKERRNTVVIETREASVAGSGQTRTRPMAPSAIV